MYYRNEVTGYLQSNRILALKLDHALMGVREKVADHVTTIGAGATRLLYYTSCFTDEYQDVCQKQKIEDLRFRDGVIHLLQHGGVVYDMLKIYFEQVFKNRTSDQIEHIKKMLMAVNIHIAANYLTSYGFALAVATYVCFGMNLSLELSTLAGRWAARGLVPVGFYGVIQKAADSAHNLQVAYPAYHAALYAQELEMMYFLIEPVFLRAGALDADWASDSHIAEIITRMVR